MSKRYMLVTRNGCNLCGVCAGIIPGWPETTDTVTMGGWAYMENEEKIDRLLASCPSDLIELREVG